jgi:hypothetical protein
MRRPDRVLADSRRWNHNIHYHPVVLAAVPEGCRAAVGQRVHALTRQVWEHPSPKVGPPPETYAGMRRLAADLLPGVRFRRHLLWRYSLVWTKPE